MYIPPSTPPPKATTPRSSLIVRPALPSDVSSFPEMKVRTWVETYHAFGVPLEWLNEPPDVEGFRAHYPERIANPDNTTWVAYDDVEHKVVGYVTAVKKPNRHGYIDIRALYILTEYQGLGLGRRLVEGAVGGKDVRAIVETLQVNIGAKNFYQALGFSRVVGIEPGNMGGVDTPGIVLARDSGGLETPLELIRASA